MGAIFIESSSSGTTAQVSGQCSIIIHREGHLCTLECASTKV